MSILDEFRAVRDAQNHLTHLKNSILDRFVKAGGTWKVLAMVDKISAIQLCRTQDSIDLHSAKIRVESFLENN